MRLIKMLHLEQNLSFIGKKWQFNNTGKAQ